MANKRIGTEEAANMIGVTRARISQLCQQGLLEAVFVSNVWLIDENSARIFAQERRRRKRASCSKR